MTGPSVISTVTVAPLFCARAIGNPPTHSAAPPISIAIAIIRTKRLLRYELLDIEQSLRNGGRRATPIRFVRHLSGISERHSGKNLGGPYKTREEAAKRLREVEYFKRHK